MRLPIGTLLGLFIVFSTRVIDLTQPMSQVIWPQPTLHLRLIREESETVTWSLPEMQEAAEKEHFKAT